MATESCRKPPSPAGTNTQVGRFCIFRFVVKVMRHETDARILIDRLLREARWDCGSGVPARYT